MRDLWAAVITSCAHFWGFRLTRGGEDGGEIDGERGGGGGKDVN